LFLCIPHNNTTHPQHTYLTCPLMSIPCLLPKCSEFTGQASDLWAHVQEDQHGHEHLTAKVGSDTRRAEDLRKLMHPVTKSHQDVSSFSLPLAGRQGN
jgi:hypothetical protein